MHDVIGAGYANVKERIKYRSTLSDPENEPLHGASFPGTYTVLLPSSLLRKYCACVLVCTRVCECVCVYVGRKSVRVSLSTQKCFGRIFVLVYLC